MESNDELKEIDIKKRTYYHLDGIIKIEDFDFNNVSIDEKETKIFWFITFHTKL